MRRSLRIGSLLGGLLALALALAVAVLPAHAAQTAAGSGSIPTRITCVGDSLTYGYRSTNASADNNGVGTGQYTYPAKLQTFLGSGYTVTNCGRNSSTAREGMSATDADEWNISYKDTPAHTASLNSNPDVVIIMLGTNDSKAANWNETEFKQGLTNLINEYKGLDSKPTVFVATSPSVDRDGATSDTMINNDTITNEVVPAQKAVAEATDCPVLDMNTLTQMVPEADYYTDSNGEYDPVHFSNLGYQKLAQFMYQGLADYYGVDLTRITCVGDSITLGTSSASGNTVYSNQTWPYLLQDSLGSSGFIVTNCGRGWACASQGYPDKENSARSYNLADGGINNKRSAYYRSINSDPDIVLISLGTNDSSGLVRGKLENGTWVLDDTYEEGLTTLVRTYQNLPSHPDVYIVTATRLPGDPSHNLGENLLSGAYIRDSIVPTQKKVAEATGCGLIDMNAYSYDSMERSDWGNDGVHPLPGGYQKMATFLQSKLTAYTGGVTASGTNGNLSWSIQGTTLWLDSTDGNPIQLASLAESGPSIFGENAPDASVYQGITSVRTASGKALSATGSLAGAFRGLTGLTSIQGLGNLDVSGVTSLAGAFEGCTSLEPPALYAIRVKDSDGGWDVSHVADFSNMFKGCTGLTDVGNIASWNVSAATKMDGMFQGCTGLTAVNLLPTWTWPATLPSVEDMFQGCTALTTLATEGAPALFDYAEALGLPSVEFNIDYTAETLTITPSDEGDKFTVNGLGLDNETLGKDGRTIDLSKLIGDADQTLTATYAADVLGDLPAGAVTVPARPAAPTPGTRDNGDGSGAFTGLTAGASYDVRAKGGAWETLAADTDGAINLAEGTYEIRLAATESSFASAVSPVTCTVAAAPEPVVHKVTFDFCLTNTKNLVIEVEDGHSVNYDDVEDPACAGWIFSGWYTDKALTKAFDFSAPVTSDMTVYAKWVEDEIDSGDHTGDTTPVKPDDTTDKGGNAAKGDKNGKGGLPQTGDATSLAGLALVALAGAGAVAMGARRRSQR